jgi:GrpB-like predicted nucleotidyltransferase (UPF0157 family)
MHGYWTVGGRVREVRDGSGQRARGAAPEVPLGPATQERSEAQAVDASPGASSGAGCHGLFGRIALSWVLALGPDQCPRMPQTDERTAHDISFGRVRFEPCEPLSRLSGVIQVVEYDPTWPRRFEQLRREYADTMAAAGVPVVAIEHVRSSSVPGLAAKPVIDCDIVVAEQDVPAASATLVDLGFKPRGELGIPLRWAFEEPGRLAGTNTYVVVDGCLSLRNHLAVRDILRSDPVLRDEYAAVN